MLLTIAATNISNASEIFIERVMRDEAVDPHFEFSVSEDRTDKEPLNNENRKY